MSSIIRLPKHLELMNSFRKNDSLIPEQAEYIGMAFGLYRLIADRINYQSVMTDNDITTYASTLTLYIFLFLYTDTIKDKPYLDIVDIIYFSKRMNLKLIEISKLEVLVNEILEDPISFKLKY